LRTQRLLSIARAGDAEHGGKRAAVVGSGYEPRIEIGIVIEAEVCLVQVAVPDQEPEDQADDDADVAVEHARDDAERDRSEEGVSLTSCE
jgi:hypothetical protein